MKKNLWIFAAAAVALAACSNDDTIAQYQEDAISFRPIVENVTRATDITALSLQTSGFTVFATEANDFSASYFGETAFTWNSSNNTYNSTTKYYWPSSGALDFYAYAYNGAEGQVTHTANTKVFVVTPDDAAADQTDLVFANTNGKSKDGSYNSTTNGAAGVPLNFRHAESKVTIKLVNSSTSMNFTVKDVKIGNVFTTGTYTYSGSTAATNTDGNNSSFLKYADWTGQGTSGSYTQTATTTSYTSTTTATALPQSFILIPQALTQATAYSAANAGATFSGPYVTVQLKIQNAENDAYIVGGADSYVEALWPLPTTQWNPGYHYTYTVDLIGGGYFTKNQDTNADLDPILEGAEIKFVSVTVDGWGDGSNTNVGMIE